MEVSAHIDWISLTSKSVTTSGASKASIKRLISAYLPENLSVMNWITTKPQNGYAVAMKSETGILIMSHPERPEMGTHIVMSGGTLANNLEYGFSPEKSLGYFLGNGWKPTRIDFAVDAKNSGLRIGDLANEIELGIHKSRARSAPYLDDKIRKGKTQYVGSMRNRTKLFRAYDKAFDLGLDGQDWKRFEIELHGQHAVASADMATKTDNLSKMIQAIIKAYIDFPENETWREIMGTDEIWLSVPEKKQGNTEQWLLTQVAPALAKVLDLDESFMFRFMEVVQENREL